MFRVYVRIKTFKRLYYDDLMIVIVWLLYLSIVIIWQLNKDDLYEIMAVSNDQLFPFSTSFLKSIEKYLRDVLVANIFFQSSFEASRLGQKVKKQK